MTLKARNQRSTDTGDLKEKIASYFPQPLPPHQTNEAMALRGFNCPIHARLLCPRRHLDVFDRDPMYVCQVLFFPFSNAFIRDFMNKVRTRAVEITAGEFLTFLYDEDITYSPEDVDIGLLRSQLLLMVRNASMLSASLPRF